MQLWQQFYRNQSSGEANWHLVLFNQGISLDWLRIETLSGAVFVSHGSCACAVCLLLRELVMIKGANISAHLTTVYFGGPPLALDLGLFGIVVFDPLSMVSLFVGCGSLHPQIQHMAPAFQGEVENFSSQNETFVQSAITSVPSNIQQYSILHEMWGMAFFIWL